MTVTFRLKAADSSSSCSLDRRFLLADLRPVFEKKKEKKKTNEKKKMPIQEQYLWGVSTDGRGAHIKIFFKNKFKKRI